MVFQKLFSSNRSRVYLDYAAATPLGKAASSAFARFYKAGLGGVFGNPSSVHLEGHDSRKVLDEVRREMALSLSINPDEIIFTSGGTESNNLAIIGVFREAKKIFKNPQIISSVIEHSATIGPMREAENDGAELTFVGVSSKGVVDKEEIANALSPDTILVTLSHVNSELGTVAPIREIGKILKSYKKQLGRDESDYPYLHVDSSQAASLLDVSPHNLNADFVTIDSSKMYGPKGVGALLRLRERKIKKIIFGGGQEGGLRAGTENMPAIAAFVASFGECVKERKGEYERLAKLKEYFVEKLKAEIPSIDFNCLSEKQLPNFVSVCLKGLDAEYAVFELDSRGVAASSASACQSIGGNGRSYVIASLSENSAKECASSTIRFSLGRFTRKRDINVAIKALLDIARLHKLA